MALAQRILKGLPKGLSKAQSKSEGNCPLVFPGLAVGTSKAGQPTFNATYLIERLYKRGVKDFMPHPSATPQQRGWKIRVARNGNAACPQSLKSHRRIFSGPRDQAEIGDIGEMGLARGGAGYTGRRRGSAALVSRDVATILVVSEFGLCLFATMMAILPTLN